MSIHVRLIIICYKIQINLSLKHLGWEMQKTKVSELPLGSDIVLFSCIFL